MDENEDNTLYRVVVNHEEQYAIWPVQRDLPAGEQPREGRPLGGGVHHGRDRQEAEAVDDATDQLRRLGDRAEQPHRVAAADAAEERILLAPHDERSGRLPNTAPSGGIGIR